MFRISPDKVPRTTKKVPNTVSASSRTKPITVSQPSVITKKGMNSNSNGFSSTGLDNTKTRRPQPRSNTKHDRVPSVSKRTHKILATPKPRKPRFLLRWTPTGRLFDQDGKLVAPSNSESQVNCFNGDNACTSNAVEPKIKWFPNSTSLLGRLSRFVYGASTQVVPST
nr:hypothetical protein [Tanacetum cinerariifolium]